MHWLALLCTIVLIHPVWFPLVRTEWQWSILAFAGMMGLLLFLILARTSAFNQVEETMKKNLGAL